jgi:hypothetical protein
MSTATRVPEIIPNPDPSTVTSAAIDRAVKNAVDIIEANSRADGIRIDSIEKAIGVFQSDLTRVPTQLDRAIAGIRDVIDTRLNGIADIIFNIQKSNDLRPFEISTAIKSARELMEVEIQKLAEVTTERFIGIASQFSERDTRTDQRAGDTKLAVDAAFAAAKEATAKIEAGFTKQIDAMITIIDTKTGNLAGGLGDIKERMTTIEARTQGISLANADHRNVAVDNRGLFFGLIGIVTGVGAILIAILLHIK